MNTLSISVSELELRKFGIKKNNLPFSDLVDLISNELAKQAMDRSLELAEKYGLSKMTMEEIDKEVKAVRGSE